MNTIKKVSVIALFVLGNMQMSAQQKQIYNDGIIVRQHALQQQGDSLLIDIELDVNNLELSSRGALTLTPALIGKETEQPLQSILLNGRNRHKVYVRDVSLRKIEPGTYYTEVKMTDKDQRIIRYRQAIPFAAWMSEARLVMNEDLCGCGGYTREATEEELFAVAPVLVPVKKEDYQIQPMFSYIKPAIEKVKQRTELRDIFLSFPVNKVIIYPDYFSNAAELTRAQEMVEKINTDKNLHIREVVIRGYASPEGSVPSNYRLSEGRAAALKNYLVPRIKGEVLPMRSESGGEDWEGVIQLLESSDVPGREALLTAIRDGNRSDAAEQTLRSIQGGTPYSWMLKEIYPKVRRVLCSVQYTVREFTVEEGRDIIRRNPEQLSLFEMYQIADSYAEGSSEFMEAFDTAVRIYPTDETALLNAATVSLVKGDVGQAEMYLKGIHQTNQALHNTFGVLEMMKGNCEMSETYLKKAVAEGSKAAQHNLEELEKKCGNNK